MKSHCYYCCKKEKIPRDDDDFDEVISQKQLDFYNDKDTSQAEMDGDVVDDVKGSGLYQAYNCQSDDVKVMAGRWGED